MAFMVLLLLIGHSSSALTTITKVSVDTTATATAMPGPVRGGIGYLLMSETKIGAIFGLVNEKAEILKLFDKNGDNLVKTTTNSKNKVRSLVLKDPLKLFIGECATLDQNAARVYKSTLSYLQPTWSISSPAIALTKPANLLDIYIG